MLYDGPFKTIYHTSKHFIVMVKNKLTVISVDRKTQFFVATDTVITERASTSSFTTVALLLTSATTSPVYIRRPFWIIGCYRMCGKWLYTNQWEKLRRQQASFFYKSPWKTSSFQYTVHLAIGPSVLGGDKRCTVMNYVVLTTRWRYICQKY